MPSLIDSPFAVLSFLAAPAILTNASTVLALGTSNRLARAADRARLLSSRLLSPAGGADPQARELEAKDFAHAITRARLLVRALRCFYLAAGLFAAGTCVCLIGATAAYVDVDAVVVAGQILMLILAVLGVGAVSIGAWILVAETRLALRVLDDEEAAVAASRSPRGTL